jgi:CBS-domain-containing membrane protein
MTDLRRSTPVTVSRDASLDDANRIMKSCNVHYLLVADEQAQLLGIVTEAGTKGHRPLGVAHTLGIRPGDLVVGNVMINKHDDVEVMHLRDVTAARVGNVVATLKELGTPYCLVVDHDEEDNHVLCGVFSLSQIERAIGLSPQSVEVAQTFSQVVSSLGH